MTTTSSTTPSSASLQLGFLGCGKISSALARGFLHARLHTHPTLPSLTQLRPLIVSQRSNEKSKQLQEEFSKDNVIIASSNEWLVQESDIVFIALLPATAREILPQLDFTGKYVVSVMAAVNFEEVLTLTRTTKENCTKICPLPSVSHRAGPILTYPPQSKFHFLLAAVGTVVDCETEAQMKPLISVAGHISPFFELMHVTQQFLIKEGIPETTARDYVSSFYYGLSQGAMQSPSTFAELTHEAATPGGLNEQAITYLRGTDHNDVITQSLQSILERLRK